MKQIFLKSFCARCLTLLVLALLSTNLAWGGDGNEVSSVADIVSGKTYYIKGVRNVNKVATTYYLKFTDEKGSQSGTEESNIEDAIAITFNKVSDGVYTLKTPKSFYIAPGTSNGKINVSSTAINVTATDQSSKIRLSITSGSDTWSIQKNISASNFGGYKNTQTDITLIEAAASKTLSSIAVKTAPTKVVYTEGDKFDPTGLVITATYSDASTQEIAYSENESDFTFAPSLTTALLESNTSVTITYGGKTCTQDITVNAAPHYTVTIIEPENGTLNVKNGETVVKNGDGFISGTVLTIEATPATGYKFRNWQYKKDQDGSKWVSNTATFIYTIGTEDVSFTANFDPLQTYTINYMVNGVNTGAQENVYEGTALVFPAVSELGGKVLVGWSTSAIAGTTNERPELVNTVGLTATADATYYAVFANKEGEEYYAKVTSAPADWCGKYLIVYETGNVAFDGSLETLDAVSNTKAVTISNNVIASSRDMDAIAFTVAYKTGSSTVYSLKSASGKYISGTTTKASASNGLKQAETDEDYEISFNGLTIESKSSDQQMLLKYNKATDQTRFRFYKSGQEDVALYKKQEATYSDYCTDVSYTRTVNTANIGTLCVPYAFEKPETITLYNIVGKADGKIYFEETEDVVAGQPYLFRSTEENITLTYTGEKADVAGTNNGLVGTFEGCAIDANAGNYILSGNKLYFVDGDFNCGANRAYIHIGSVSAYNPSTAKADFTLDFNEPTGIESITPTFSEGKEVYNLNGMRVNPSTGSGQAYKGIVIMNGKKYINK